uniref:Uncharacterized protein n=1 Tax=Rhodnius prolixus TaxID=13249 RepID=T1HRK9_RHOPR
MEEQSGAPKNYLGGRQYDTLAKKRADLHDVQEIADVGVEIMRRDVLDTKAYNYRAMIQAFDSHIFSRDIDFLILLLVSNIELNSGRTVRKVFATGSVIEVSPYVECLMTVQEVPIQQSTGIPTRKLLPEYHHHEKWKQRKELEHDAENGL